jgi:ubiquinone/menaquinone biosynthesis C-methylase UbiE
VTIEPERIEKPNVGSFGNVDSQKEAEEFIKMVTWVKQQPQTVAVRGLSYDRLDLKAGDLTLDVGCGTGRAVAEIADRGSPSVGVDISKKMIGTAKLRFPAHDFRVASAENLPFDGGSIKRYRAERVYSFLKDPAAALREARRVLSPEGRIALIDIDWDTWVVDSDNQTVTRAIVRANADSIPQRWIG